MRTIAILIVDDNPSIHIDFRKILQSQTETADELEEIQETILGNPHIESEYEFDIDSAYQGEEALRLIQQKLTKNQHYSLAFVDIRMPPGIDGVETTRHIWEIDPDIQIVICTAYSDYSWEELNNRLKKAGSFLILKKPFENIEVLQFTYALSKKWELNQQLQCHLHNLEKLVEERTLELKKNLSALRATLEATSDGILSVDLKQRINFYNQRCLKILNISKNIIEREDDNLARREVTRQILDAERFISKVKEAYTDFGREIHDVINFKDGRIVEYFSIPQYIGNKVTGRVFSFREVTDQKRMEDQLIQQATHDTLTGLHNRVVLYDRVQQSLASAKLNGYIVAILYLDLDNFKLMNDTLGRDVGDEVLKYIANILRDSIRENDTIARIGGDEFVIVIPDLKKIDAVIPICQKILKAVSEPFNIENQSLSLTTSIGISVFPKNGSDSESLIRNANAAKQNCKHSGQNNFAFFTSEMNINAINRLMMENNLRRALGNNEFLLYYQPLIELKTNKIIGVEALLRWKQPEHGFIQPEKFIPIAEEIGMMLPIGDFVLNSACLQSAAWIKLGLNPIHMSINLTANHISQSNIVEKISNLIQNNNLDPKYLDLEVTESIIIENTDRVLQIIHELKNTGVSIVIDDFGTGYSSLSYLNRLPIDKIKIDRSFINFVSPNPKDVIVILAILTMTKSLNIRSLTEGVETKEQLEILKQHGCDEIQSYYFYRPMTVQEITKVLKDNQS